MDDKRKNKGDGRDGEASKYIRIKELVDSWIKIKDIERDYVIELRENVANEADHKEAAKT